MSYFPLTDTDRNEMLADIGVKSFDDLIAAVPRELRLKKLDLPRPVSEYELRRMVTALAERNGSTATVLSFAGCGAYEHFIPAVVHHVTSRSEFYTAYTPYQAEASQGTLQTIYEFQSIICALTGMDVATASHYDGATATAEAALLAVHLNGRKRVLASRSLHPDYRAVLKTYLAGTAIPCDELPFTAEGRIDLVRARALMTDEVACCIVQTPNVFGVIEDLRELETIVHACGALFVIVANPLSYVRLKSAAEWHADIACGDAQVFGNALSYGGPSVGYFAATKALMRKVPGRIVGMTKDAKGRRAFTLTLQTREQHIRREKATSNICSNQALCALAATVHVSALGTEGLRRIADINMANTQYLRDAFRHLRGCSELFAASPVFNEFVVTCDRNADEVIAALLERGIHAGIALERWYPELKNALVLCATETKTREDLDRFVRELGTVVGK